MVAFREERSGGGWFELCDTGGGGGGKVEVFSASHCLNRLTTNQSRYAFCGVTLSPLLAVNSDCLNNVLSTPATKSAKSSTLSSTSSRTRSGTWPRRLRSPDGHAPTTCISASWKMDLDCARYPSLRYEEGYLAICFQSRDWNWRRWWSMRGPITGRAS